MFGAGPVGLMAAYSGVIRGAAKVFVVDQVKERLEAAANVGCIPINFRDGDPVQQIIDQNGGMVDRAVDAVGYQAVDKSGSKEQPNVVLDQLIMVTRPTGGLGKHTTGAKILLLLAFGSNVDISTRYPRSLRAFRPWRTRCSEWQRTDLAEFW